MKSLNKGVLQFHHDKRVLFGGINRRVFCFKKNSKAIRQLTSSVHTSLFSPLHRGALERKTLKLKISLGNCDQKLNVSEALFL